jgi:hypothetical protein
MTEPMASPAEQLSQETIDFYCKAMETLQQAGVPFLVGGAYAYARYTGVVRHTKDFDVFIDPADFDRALEAFTEKGWKVERNFPHWLGKTWNDNGEDFVDLIFSSGNGVARVDHRWFEYAVDEEVLGMKVKLCPAEEMIWSKSFIMERERFDGADVAHLLHARADDIDWDRMLERFEGHHRVLFAHLLLFGYIYPGEAHRIPEPVFEHLLAKVREDRHQARNDKDLCRGTILSRGQYLLDVEEWDYKDARIAHGHMTEEEVGIWTEAAREEAKKQLEKS